MSGEPEFGAHPNIQIHDPIDNKLELVHRLKLVVRDSLAQRDLAILGISFLKSSVHDTPVVHD
jgi:hypothetical protein